MADFSKIDKDNNKSVSSSELSSFKEGNKWSSNDAQSCRDTPKVFKGLLNDELSKIKLTLEDGAFEKFRVEECYKNEPPAALPKKGNGISKLSI